MLFLCCIGFTGAVSYSLLGLLEESRKSSTTAGEDPVFSFALLGAGYALLGTFVSNGRTSKYSDAMDRTNLLMLISIVFYYITFSFTFAFGSASIRINPDDPG